MLREGFIMKRILITLICCVLLFTSIRIGGIDVQINIKIGDKEQKSCIEYLSDLSMELSEKVCSVWGID